MPLIKTYGVKLCLDLLYLNLNDSFWTLTFRFKGEKEVRKSAKYEMSYEDEIAALVIHETVPEDADVYRCQATNALGKVQTQGTLAVHSK